MTTNKKRGWWRSLIEDESLFTADPSSLDDKPAPDLPKPTPVPATPPSASVTLNLRAITVGDIYILCWKIWLATFLFAVPFAIIWIISSRP